MAFCKEALLTNHEYLDFEAFWEDRSSFSLEGPVSQRPPCLSAVVHLRPAVPAFGGPPRLPGLGHQRDPGPPADRLCLQS